VKDKIETKWQTLTVDEDGKTNVEKIFSGGDVSNNVADAVSAVADGHKAAIGIDKFLNK